MVDWALVAFVTVIALAQQTSADDVTPGTSTVGLVFAGLFPLPLVVRRRAPVTVLVVMAGLLVVWGATGAATSGAGIPVMVALYTVAAYRPARVSVPVGVLTVGWLLGVQLQVADTAADLVELVATCAAAWWLGSNTRTRRSQSEALAAYAQQLTATQEQLADQRVAEERLRIAREMHDIVAHSLGVVAVQASVAEHLLDQDPGQARASVATIKEVSRTGLTDMRRTLGVLRGDDEPVDRVATPRLSDLPELVQTHASGSQLDIDLRISGQPAAPLDPALELSVYRVVQEALTNACKHAPGSDVTVDVTYGPGAVDVEIVDDGSDTPLDLPGSGNGVAGMRERVGMFGGTFEAARRIGGGFRVRAHFPATGAA
jgi:signal transduction histidine kinase